MSKIRSTNLQIFQAFSQHQQQIFREIWSTVNSIFGQFVNNQQGNKWTIQQSTKRYVICRLFQNNENTKNIYLLLLKASNSSHVALLVINWSITVLSMWLILIKHKLYFTSRTHLRRFPKIGLYPNTHKAGWYHLHYWQAWNRISPEDKYFCCENPCYSTTSSTSMRSTSWM